MNPFEKLTLIEPPLTITPDSLLAEGRKRVRRRRLLTLTATPLALVGGGVLAVSLLTGGLSTTDHAVVTPASTPPFTPAPTAPERPAIIASPNPDASTTSPSPSQPVTDSPSKSAAPSPDTVRPTGTGAIVTDGPGIFIGVWSAHGRTLRVNGDGSASVVYRSYVDCSQSPTPPCDGVRGSGIVPGGHVTLRITRVVTANRMSEATATVIASNDPEIARGSKVTFVLDGDVITHSPFDAFCGAKAKSPESDPCGA
jgi:hypothetical protein